MTPYQSMCTVSEEQPLYVLSFMTWLCSADIPTVRPHSRTTLYVYPGEEFTLACSITDSVGDFRVVWYNEGTPVQDDVTSEDHIYQIVGRNRGGKYSCTASNIAGNASVDFTVHGKALVLMVPTIAGTSVLMVSIAGMCLMCMCD